MISTKSLLAFYTYYAMWAAAGHRIMWWYGNGRYCIIKLKMAKLK